MPNLQLPAFPGLQIAGPARADTPFVAAGRQALATGWAATGVEEIWIHPFRALRRLRVDGAASAHAARLTPAGFERRFLVGNREVLERVFVPASGGTVILEWALLPPLQASAPCLDPLDLELEWECDLARPDTAMPPVRRPEPAATAAVPPLQGSVTARSILVVQGSPGSTAAAAFHGSRVFAAGVESLPPDRARPHPGLRCRLGVRLVSGEKFVLVVSAAAETAALGDGAGPDIDVPVLVAARVADGQRRAGEHLALSATDPLVGQALRWAALRLPAYLAELDGDVIVTAGYAPGTPPRPSAGAALRVGLASLALGDPALAAATMRAALDEAAAAAALGQPAASAGWSPGVPPGTAALLLHAQHHLWTASSVEAREAWPRLLRIARGLPAGAAGAPAETCALIAAALAQLALVAEGLGQAGQAAELRAAAAPLARAEAAAAALAGACGWTPWAEGAAAAAYRGWHALAESGLGPARALWPGPAGPDDASAAARVIGAVAYGMLGIEADAPRARLRLRPQLPEDWERATVEHLRLGDAEVTMSWVVSESVHRFEIEQLGGAVPLRLVFEPAVAGELESVRVDGLAASLALRPWGERTLVPVQLVLDDRRRIEIAVRRPELKRRGPG